MGLWIVPGDLGKVYWGQLLSTASCQLEVTYHTWKAQANVQS